MKKIKILSFAILGAIVVSCGTSNNVVSGKLISKRKVNKGFHINTSQNLKGSGDETKTVKRPEFIQYTEETILNTKVEDNIIPVEPTTHANFTEATLVSDEINVIENEALSSELNTISSTKTNVVTADRIQKNENKISKEDKKEFKKAIKKSGGDVPIGLLYVLCVLIPFVAVGLATDWDVKTVVFNLLWCLLCFIPGVIHAFIVVSREA